MPGYRTEIVRLRAALKRITQECVGLESVPGIEKGEARAYRALAAIARAALDDKPPPSGLERIADPVIANQH